MTCPRCQPARLQAGLTLVEAVVCLLVVSMMLVAALNTVGASRLTRRSWDERARGAELAGALMSEILETHFEDVNDPPIFGRESSESGADRSDWDDVDDYHGWLNSPPQRRDGSVLAHLAGWTREVAVTWADPSNLQQDVAAQTGIKRIRVIVRRGPRVVAERIALRTEAWPDPDVPDQPPYILFVVADADSPTPQEQVRVALLESWNRAVVLISGSESQETFDAFAANAVAAYVSAEPGTEAMGNKLTRVAFGIVNENRHLVDDLKFSSAFFDVAATDQTSITNQPHYITDTLPAQTNGDILLLTSPQPLWSSSSEPAPDLLILAEVGKDNRFVVALEAGAVTARDELGFPIAWAAGRRVAIGWGGSGFDLGALNSDGRMLLQRALEWATGEDQP
ncbi:MAG: hypothetical protein OER86_02805 [Phycisphaerae bacterium]|nr:hypothetical protein [Phycisphaerae bacterium]